MFVTLPGDRACVRWRRPVITECEISSYEVSYCELDEQGGLRCSADGKHAWSLVPNSDISSAKPEQQLQLKPIQKYVARVRTFGTAKEDAKAKLRSEWSGHSEPFTLAKRMGGGFGLVQSAEVDMAMARARRRSMDAAAARNSRVSKGDGGDAASARNTRVSKGDAGA